MSEDQFTETTTQSWGSRITESIKGVLVGIILFLVAFPLLWWNEGSAVQTYKSLQEGRDGVVKVNASSVDPANDKSLVHISGRATTGETLSDPTFSVPAQAIRLERLVEMYQWEETKESKKKKKIGGKMETKTTYTYSKKWGSQLIDSSHFKKPEGHQNPSSMEFSSSSWMAEEVAVGAFELSDNLKMGISKTETIPFTQEMLANLPESVSGIARVVSTQDKEQPKAKKKKRKKFTVNTQQVGRAKIHGESLYIGKDPQNPQIGDLRITFRKVLPDEVSIIAQQNGNHLSGYQTEAGDVIEMLRMGTVSTDQMFAEAESAKKALTWLLRLLGFSMMLFGISLVMRPLAVIADVIPLIGDILRFGFLLFGLVIALPLSLLTIATAWIFYRPILGVVLIVFSVGIVVVVKMVAAKRKAAAAA
jgi:hypothetical protein